MNKIYAFVVSTLALAVPVLWGLALALGWITVVKVLFGVWTIVEWALIAVIVQMLFENREEEV